MDFPYTEYYCNQNHLMEMKFDLNGDKVDDFGIADKLGKPAIVIGYEFVKASPKKNIWKQKYVSNKTI